MKSIWVAFALFPAIVSAGDLWGVANVTSYHIDAHKDYNTQNFGAGLEYHMTENIILMTGAFRNSFYKTSAYAVAGYTPLNLFGAKIGAAAGAANGYDGLNHGGATPVIFALVRMEGESVGANIVVLPPALKNSPVTIGLQLKFKF